MLQEIVQNLFNPESIWFFLFQSAVWFGICLTIMITIGAMRPAQRAYGSLKQNMGFFLLFVVLSTGLLYIMFGQQV